MLERKKLKSRSPVVFKWDIVELTFLIMAFLLLVLLDTWLCIKGAFWISSNSSFIQYCDSKVVALYPFASIFVYVL